MWIRTIVLSLTGLMAILNTPIAMAQQADDTGGRRGGRSAAQSATQESPAVRCFNITRSNPTKIADYIGQLYGRGRVVDMPANGKILFMGTEQEIAQVETLLKEIDIPEMNTGSDPDLTIIPIQNRTAHDILCNIQPVLSGLPDNVIRISADDIRSCIIVLSRSKKALTAVSAMITDLDMRAMPVRHVALEFAFFQADLNQTTNNSTIPDDLQEVAGELGRFGNVTLLGRLFADTTEGGRFKVEGQIHDHVTARVEGRVEDTAQDRPTRISVEAKAIVEDVQASELDSGKTAKSRSNGAFAIETQLVVDPGQFVVIGGSPAGLANGQSIMLAVRVKQ